MCFVEFERNSNIWPHVFLWRNTKPNLKILSILFSPLSLSLSFFLMPIWFHQRRDEEKYYQIEDIKHVSDIVWTQSIRWWLVVKVDIKDHWENKESLLFKWPRKSITKQQLFPFHRNLLINAKACLSVSNHLRIYSNRFRNTIEQLVLTSINRSRENFLHDLREKEGWWRYSCERICWN